jgi:hypothetical protein
MGNVSLIIVGLMMSQTQQEGSVLVEQQQNSQNVQGQSRFSIEASQTGSENFGGALIVGGKHGHGELRASCEAGLVGSGSMVGLPISAKVVDRREIFSPSSYFTSSNMWGSVACAMTTCGSPGVAVRHQTPSKDWLQDFDL